MSENELSPITTAVVRLRGGNPLAINDLRLRVLNGEDIEADEMLSIIDQIRQNRRSAARAPAKPKAKRGASAPLSEGERESLLSGEI